MSPGSVRLSACLSFEETKLVVGLVKLKLFTYLSLSQSEDVKVFSKEQTLSFLNIVNCN